MKKNETNNICRVFASKTDLVKHIAMNMPIAVKPIKTAKTSFVNPFTSVNAMTTCINAIADSLINNEAQQREQDVNCFKTDGENLIETLGFKFEIEYDHDQFHTNRYKNGLLTVEFTYNNENLHTVDLIIDETFCKPITYIELCSISPILGEFLK